MYIYFLFFDKDKGRAADVMMNNLRWMHFIVLVFFCLIWFWSVSKVNESLRLAHERTLANFELNTGSGLYFWNGTRSGSGSRWYSGHFFEATAQIQRSLIRFYRLRSGPIRSDHFALGLSWGDVRMCDSIFWLFLWRIKQTRPCANYLFKILQFLLLLGVALASSGKQNKNK